MQHPRDDLVEPAVIEDLLAVVAQYNNAGIAHNGDVEKTEFKDIERIMDVDFWG